MTHLAIVCGLKAEAKIAAGSDVTVIAGGGDAARILSQLDAIAPDAVLSFGVAGGLAPDLGAGAACVAAAVVAPDGYRFTPDSTWSAAMVETLGVSRATFAGVDVPLADASAKAALHTATGADLVDMESHLVAGWAARRGVRFAALRVVTDPAERSLPPAAIVGMRADGKVDLWAILASLTRNPAQLPGLIRTGLDAQAAFAQLLRCRKRLGPRFALLDL